MYDVSLRVPGNPILATTSPYTKYQYGQTFGVGRRIAIEIKKAYEEILACARELVEYHEGQSQKAMGLYEHLLGYGPIDYPYK